MLTKFLAVGAGGAIGAMLRFAIHLYWTRRVAFPLGTLSANVLGCLLIGVVMAISMRRDWPGEHAKLLIVTGLFGALTTYSTFAFETLDLAQQGKAGAAIVNVAANLTLSLGAVWLGWTVSIALMPKP